MFKLPGILMSMGIQGRQRGLRGGLPAWPVAPVLEQQAQLPRAEFWDKLRSLFVHSSEVE